MPLAPSILPTAAPCSSRWFSGTLRASTVAMPARASRLSLRATLRRATQGQNRASPTYPRLTLRYSEAVLVREGEPRLLAEAAVLGVIGAFSAQLFTWALRICE